MPDQDQPTRYALARLRGLSDTEAAAEAGYNRSSKAARDLWDAVDVMRGSWDMQTQDSLAHEHDRIADRIAGLERKRAEAADELRRVELFQRALTILETK